MAIGSPQWMYKSGEAYTIDQSLKYNDDDSASLTRTPSSTSNRKTWTWSAWVKRGAGGFEDVFKAFVSTSNYDSIQFDSDGALRLFGHPDTTNYVATTSAVFRDSSAWYHFVVVLDTTQSTSSNRIKIYANGTLQTLSGTYPGLDGSLNFNKNTAEHSIAPSNFDGYLSEVNFVDGQALTPADFGETGDYGEWKPKEYSGTYGTNGFYLNFAGGGVMSATGGNSTTTDGDYKAASFTSSGTFTPSADGYVEYLVIAGGGAGGGAPSRYGSGGGAGGYRTGYLAVTGGTAYSVTVGAGGTVTSNVPSKGGDSVFSTITSTGGGRGATTASGVNDYTTDINGGSGGGAGTYGQGSAGTGISGQGNNGGAGASGAASGGGGGAGGAGGAGGVAGSEIGGLGGAGLASSITGSSVTRAGGGGGGAWGGTNHAGSAGGSGGGGRGNGNGNAGTDGTANTGSGGGGGGYGHNGGNGGSGIVIIRYKFQ